MRTSQHPKGFRRRHRRAFLVAIFFGVFTVFWLNQLRTPETTPVAAGDSVSLTPASEGQERPPDWQPERLVYPYSLIDGGVRSVEELRAAAANDPMLAKHYADLDLDAARVIAATEAKPVYVSYRLPTGVFWTSQRVQLATGEGLISDGRHIVRMRCGNMVSDEPVQQTSREEPALEILDRPSRKLIPVHLRQRNPLDQRPLAFIEAPGRSPQTSPEAEDSFLEPGGIPVGTNTIPVAGGVSGNGGGTGGGTGGETDTNSGTGSDSGGSTPGTGSNPGSDDGPDKIDAAAPPPGLELLLLLIVGLFLYLVHRRPSTS